MIPFIFIHLGSHSIPTYLNDSIDQCRLWNRENTIYVLCSEVNREQCNRKDVEYVFIESLKRTEHHERFIETTKLDNEFRSGFFKHTSERLFTLEDFCIDFSITEFIHLENDNMIYFSTDDIIDAFRSTVRGISAPAMSYDYVIFGIMYCNDLKALTAFNQYTVENTFSTEMNAGAAFFDANHTTTSYLPSTTQNIITDVRYIRYSSSNIGVFKGVFDPAQYGQWLGGVDPRNFASTPFSFSNTCALAGRSCGPEGYNYSVVTCENGLNRYTIERDGVAMPIYSLHIHSKYLDRFKNDRLIEHPQNLYS